MSSSESTENDSLELPPLPAMEEQELDPEYERNDHFLDWEIEAEVDAEGRNAYLSSNSRGTGRVAAALAAVLGFLALLVTVGIIVAGMTAAVLILTKIGAAIAERVSPNGDDTEEDPRN